MTHDHRDEIVVRDGERENPQRVQQEGPANNSPPTHVVADSTKGRNKKKLHNTHAHCEPLVGRVKQAR